MNSDDINKMTLGLMIAAVFVVAFNGFQIMQLSELKTNIFSGNSNALVQGTAVDSQNDSTANASLGNTQTAQNDVIQFSVLPTGIPSIYGQELGVSYDDVTANDAQTTETTIKKLAVFDQQITLEGADLERYIGIASLISCEYCCGAPSIITAEGKAACGCAHSYAMRGLAKYLIKNHATEFSDDQILEEMGKWKTLFFPTVHEQKAKALKDNAIEFSYINLASNKYRGIETGAQNSNMVGGC
ncbi:MAG: hypothetical protein Q7S21_01865 [archaeon]|nr:hypothetical protein [archaeon]